jgi:microcystin-dependent protein
MLGEIRLFAFNFAPRGWAFCQGQLLPISQYTAVFSLLGTAYGGDAKATFALPNLAGSVPIGQSGFGGNTGLSQRDLGEMGGEDYVTLLTSEMPSHSHALQCDTKAFDTNTFSPSGALPANAGALLIYSGNTGGSTGTMNPAMLSVAGGSQPHNNLMPYLALNYCICMQGVYPARS